MGKTALAVGSANQVWDEVDAALKLFTPDEIFCVNEAFVDFPGEPRHLVSFHPEIFIYWMNKRKKLKRSPPEILWTYSRRKIPPNVPDGYELRRAPNWCGSSGLLAVASALEFQCDRIVLAGIHLTPESSHYHEPKGAPWRDAINYRKGWLDHLDLYQGATRSMGGWTKKLLGAPTKDWLESPSDAENPDQAGVGAGPDRAAAR